MVDAGDFDARATHAVGDNVGLFGDDQFPRAGDPAGGAELRVFGEELFDAVGDVEGDALGGCRVVLGDVSAKRFGGRGSIPEIREGSYRAKCLLLLARLPGLDPVHDALVGSTLARRKQWPGQCPRLATRWCQGGTNGDPQRCQSPPGERSESTRIGQTRPWSN